MKSSDVFEAAAYLRLESLFLEREKEKIDFMIIQEKRKKKEKKENKHNAELQRADPGTKVTG